MKISDTKKLVIYLAAIAFILRIILSLFIVNFKDPEMWEFGMISRSLLNGDGYVFLALTKNVASAFMPPGLPFIYYFIFKLFGDNSTAYFSILLLNAALGGLSVILIYKVTEDIFGKVTAFYSSVLVTISPILIFSATAFNSIIYYQVLLLFSIYFFNKIKLKISNNAVSGSTNSIKYTLLLGITLGLFLYFRAEVLLFILFFTLYFIYRKYYVNAIITIAISLLIISPWSIRNYITFGKVIPVSTSMGYNFYTGHGDDQSTITYNERIRSLIEDSTFEIRQADISFEMAFRYIKDHPTEEISESLRKIFSLWITDNYRDSAKHPVYLLTWLPVLFLFITGTFFVFRDKGLILKTFSIYIYFIISTILVIVFFNIPRYQIQMSVLVIPVAVFGLLRIYPKLNSFIKL